MKLPLTDKYFPKSFKVLHKRKYNKSTRKLISKYSLDGLKILNPKTSKVKNVLPNDLTHAKVKTLAAVREFNNQLNLNSDKQVVIAYNYKTPNPTLIDDGVYNHLHDFLVDYYHINPGIDKFINYDKLMLKTINKKSVHVITLKDDGYFVIDLFITNSFIYSVGDLVNIYNSLHSGDKKLIKSILAEKSWYGDSIRHDSKIFVEDVKPSLPVMVLANSSYYTEESKRGKLLYLIGNFFGV